MMEEQEDNTDTEKSDDTDNSSETSSEGNDDPEDASMFDDNKIPNEPTPNMRRSERDCKVNRCFHGDKWVNLMDWRKEPP